MSGQFRVGSGPVVFPVAKPLSREAGGVEREKIECITFLYLQTMREILRLVNQGPLAALEQNTSTH